MAPSSPSDPTTPKASKMNRNAIIALSVLFMVMAGALFGLYQLLMVTPEFEVPKRLTDVEAETLAGHMGAGKGAGPDIDIAGDFVTFDEAALPKSSSWPRFRGADFSNVVSDGPALADSWPEQGPPILWDLKLGEGHAGAAVLDGRVYLLDYDEKEQGDALRTFSLADGTELWRRTYKVTTKRNHGISRTIPAVTEKYTVTMGPRCHVMCVDSQTGEYLWGIDLVKEYGSEVPLWYTGQCPLIDDGVAIIAPGGDVFMIGVDCATGEVLWKTPNPKQWQMSHASVIPMTLKGKKTYVYATMGGLVGVSAEKEDAGTLLWTAKEWSHSVISPSPIQIDDERIFLTAGYGTGSLMLKITRDGDTFGTEVVYELDKTIFGCEQQTPIFYKGHIYGILPKDSAALKGQFVCMTPEGKLVWTSGKTERYGLGPFLIADDKVYILNDDGQMTVIRASLEKFELLARHQVLTGHDAWAPMALVDGKLLLRDSQRMVCLDISANTDRSVN